MLKKIRIVMAQLNLKVGDIPGNLNKLLQAANQARDEMQAQVIVFPELAITGYPPEDLLLRHDFVEKATAALATLREKIHGIYVVVGHPDRNLGKLYNAASIIYNGNLLTTCAKQHLPNYGVFDEHRYFTPATSSCVVVPLNGIPTGIIICEDLWYPEPIAHLKQQGAHLILCINASPFEINKDAERQALLSKHAKAQQIPIVYTNCVGGQDELLFDGGSMVVDQHSQIQAHARFCKETLLSVDMEISANASTITPVPFKLPSIEEKIYQCLVLGVRDYIEKNNFPGVLIGVSGGIDSALTLAIAVDALGKDRVKAIILPSRYTSAMSLEDAAAIVKNFQVEHETISIEPTFTSLLASLNTNLSHNELTLTEENLQSRCRGIILMAHSNKSGKIVLTTGNRSELAVGYATLYGDMVGGFSVLKDIYKTQVYHLCDYRNQISALIPQRIIERAPSAELAPNQKDEDTLAPYPILDEILALYLDADKSIREIIELGHAPELVERIVNLIVKSEYKRRQAVIGVRINHKAFGKDRRYPITSGYK